MNTSQILSMATRQRKVKIKQFYSNHADRIFEKRYNSPYPLRRYVHRQIYATTLKYIEAGQTVLDAGCGEGVLSILMAQQGAIVTGVDISAPNIMAARRAADEIGLADRLTFLQGDAENLPFPNGSFDVVVSSHVLEHLPDFHRGLSEIRRVMRHKAVISLPTCLNPCAWCLLGGDIYWRFTRRTPFGLPVGMARVLWAWLRREGGVDEGYAGNKSLPHVWRFPDTMRREIEAAGFKIEQFEAGTLAFPYLAQYLPASLSWIEWLDRWKDCPGWRGWGFGATAVVIAAN